MPAHIAHHRQSDNIRDGPAPVSRRNRDVATHISGASPAEACRFEGGIKKPVTDKNASSRAVSCTRCACTALCAIRRNCQAELATSSKARTAAKGPPLAPLGARPILRRAARSGRDNIKTS